MRRLLLVWVIGLGCGAAAEEFTWSWEDPAAPAGATAPAAATNAADEFNWTWDLPSGQGPASAPADAQRATPASTPAVPVQAGEYEQLVKENLDLRRQLASAMESEGVALKERERLTGEIADLERRIAESVVLIQQLQTRETGPAADPGLDERLRAAETAKTRLSEELEAMRARMAEVEAQRAQDRAAMEARLQAEADRGAAATAAVKPGSDLFRQVEAENVKLRERLAQLDGDRQQSARDREQLARDSARYQAELESLRRRAADAEQRASRSGAELQRLVQDLPRLEQELAALRARDSEQADALTRKDAALQSLGLELENRERRLEKAEKMAALLEKARADVQRINNAEKRDMHYNMAVVYAKEGRTREAEREYLRALELDPTDAYTHYNLGILYDDELEKPDRAALHYRRFLLLAPGAPESDDVRGWLLQIETAGKAAR